MKLSLFIQKLEYLLKEYGDRPIDILNVEHDELKALYDVNFYKIDNQFYIEIGD